MRSETRINLIAIAVILAVMVPGGVMMFRKKMRPGARAILGQPDPVRRVVPYMEPMEMPVHERVVPPRTWAWVRGLAVDFGLEEVAVVGNAPVMSERRGVQVLGVMGDWVVLLIWEGKGGDVTVGLAGGAGNVIRAEERAVPPEVRKELQEAGYIDPPDGVRVLGVDLAGLQRGGPRRIYVRQERGKEQWEDFVTLFTSPVDTNK